MFKSLKWRPKMTRPHCGYFNILDVVRKKINNQYSDFDNLEVFMARPEGFEPTTLGLENRCSIQLS